MHYRKVFVAAAIAFLAAGCGGGTSVGSNSLKNFQGKGGEGAISDPQHTASPGAKKAAPKAAPVKKASAQPAARATSAVTQKQPADQVALHIKINSDTGGSSQFDPSAARIYAGTCAQWVNTDTVPRSVVADDKAFNSGPIAPGKTWTWCAKTAGSHNYHDGTRPYAVANIQAVAR
jgi:plastocyanin